MVKVLLIEKNGNIKNSVIKKFDATLLYKKCSFKKKDDFDKRATWKLYDDCDDYYYVSCFSKNTGRAGSENKYDLPPPLDANELYFGTMLLLKHKENGVRHHYQECSFDKVEDLLIEEWNKLYEKLFGGFEELGNDDSYSEEEEIPEHLKTKQGYSKEDGFVVSDDDVDSDYIPEEEDDDEEEAEELTTTNSENEEELMGEESNIEEEEGEEDDNEDEDEYEDSELSDSDDGYGSELSEESYVDSD